jgi:hypothetical protein
MLINLIINHGLYALNEVAVCMANGNRLEENSDNRPTLKVKNEEINDEQKLKWERKKKRKV